MSIFGRDTKDKAEELNGNLLLEDDVNINFSPLWEDEEPSGITKWILPVLQLVILIYIAVTVHGIK